MSTPSNTVPGSRTSPAPTVATAGGKGSNLGELAGAGFPVPRGFVITADAYLHAME